MASTAAMTGSATVTPKHVFGVKADVTDNVAYLDEQTAIFPAGHNLVIHNTEQRSQKFVPGTEGSLGIIAMAVSSNRKFVAVAERSERFGDKPTISVYDLHTLRKRRTLPQPPPEVESRDLVCLAFSPDAKALLTLSGSPDWTLSVWAWEKPKPPTAYLRVSNPQHAELRHASFSPHDNTAICVTGNGICKFCRVHDNALKLIPASMGRREPQFYTCHAWLADDRVLVGTDAGNLLVVDSGELKLELAHSPADGSAIDAIAAYSKGFVCASEHGVVHAFERSEERELFKRTKSFRLDGLHSRVVALAISPSEEALLCSLASAQLYALPLSNLDILKQDEMNFEPIAQHFHTGHVTGLDTCVRKPLVATCGKDRSVRIWNYIERTVELSKTFAEEAHSIAFHVSGLFVLVGFSDKLRLMNLLIDDIRPYKELAIRACRECRFSHGGHYFAAVNGNTIQIYSTHTCDNVGNLRGHNNKVRSVAWTPDDAKLVSCGMDGAVYEWNLRDFKRVGENVLKSCAYTCCDTTADARAVFAVGSDRKLREIVGETPKEWDLGVNGQQVVLSHSGRMLFAGLENGSVRSFKFPLSGEWSDVAVHSTAGGVSRLRISHDDAFLFSAGEDGCVYVCEVKDKEGRLGGAKRDKEALAWAEEVLVTKSDLEEKTTMMVELRAKVEDLQSQNDYQLRLKELNHAEKLKEVSDKYSREIEADKRNYEILLQAKNDLELEYEDKLRQLEARHEASLHGTEATYQHKIMGEVERYQALQSEKELMAERFEEGQALLQEGHERALQELTDEYDAKLQEDALVLERVREEKAEHEATFEETRRQIEEDVDREVYELRTKYEARLAHERNETLRLKGENGIMNKKFVSLQKEIDEQKEEINSLFANKKELYAQIGSLEKDIGGLKREVKERDETISDKEKRIYDLKKKNQELEKFKFVLDYKIKELKKQIEPREIEIVELKEQGQQINTELENYHRANLALELALSDLKLKLDGLQREVISQRTKLSDADARLRAFRSELHEAMQHVQDPKALKEAVKALNARHATDQAPALRIEAELQAEYQRQRHHLERSVESLKRKLNKNMELHRGDNARMMNENITLIKEVNELRRELRNVSQLAPPRHGGRDGGQGKGGGGGGGGGGGDAGGGAEFGALREQVASLQEQLAAAHAEIRRLRQEAAGAGARAPSSSAALHRPISREQLPTMEGFEQAAAAAGAAAAANRADALDGRS